MRCALFPPRASCPAQQTTLAIYSARLGGEAGRLAADAKRAADGAEAVATAAADRRGQVEGVSLDDELLTHDHVSELLRRRGARDPGGQGDVRCAPGHWLSVEENVMNGALTLRFSTQAQLDIRRMTRELSDLQRQVASGAEANDLRGFGGAAAPFAQRARAQSNLRRARFRGEPARSALRRAGVGAGAGRPTPRACCRNRSATRSAPMTGAASPPNSISRSPASSRRSTKPGTASRCSPASAKAQGPIKIATLG